MMSRVDYAFVIDTYDNVKGYYASALKWSGRQFALNIFRASGSGNRVGNGLTGKQQITVVTLAVYFKFRDGTNPLLVSGPLFIHRKPSPYACVFCKRVSDIGQREFKHNNGAIYVVLKIRGRRYTYRYPRAFRLERLTFNSLNTFLGRFRLILSRQRLLLSNAQLFTDVQFANGSARSSGFGLTSQNLRLVSHFPNLHADETSGSKGGKETEDRNPVSSPRDGQRLSRDSESLYLKRFELIPANQLHKKWLGWLWIVTGASCVACSWRLLWRGCNWLSDLSIGGISFLLAFAGFFGLCHGIALL